MLSIEHVRCVRRKGELVRNPRWGLSAAQAEELVAELQTLAIEHHHKTRGELVAAFGDVVAAESVQRAMRAAQKLVLDQCDFAVREDIDPPSLRDALYRRAASIRSAGDPFDRDVIVAGIAADYDLDATTFETLLYADLDEARLVDATALRTMTPADLVARWELAEVQALLLRTERVTIDVDARPTELRALLRAMKLHQLLFEVEASTGGEAGVGAGGVRFVIDGPVSLFSQSLRYGLKLALLVPKIMACRVYRLQAEVQRFARDLLRLKAEIIAEKFEPQSLMAASGIPVDEQVMALLRNDAMRTYRVDIETDSTIQADVARAQQNASGFMAGFGQFMQAIGPAVQAGALPVEVARTMLQSFARSFKLGRAVEDAIDSIGQQQPQDIGAPQADAQADAQAAAQQQAQQQVQQEAQQQVQAEAQMKAQGEQMKAQVSLQAEQVRAQAMLQAEQMRIAAENQRHAAEMAMKRDIERERLAADMQARQSREMDRMAQVPN